MEHILYIMSVMNPPYGLNYSMYYWNHGLQRVARIEAVGVYFNGCEWECVWMSGLLIIWNGNKRWVLMEWRGMCHDGIPIANRWYDDDINAWWYWILWWMMLIWLDDYIQETEGMRWKMILECRLKAVEITSSTPFDRLMTKRSFSCWLLIEQSKIIHKSCFIVVMFTERMVLNVT